MSAMPDTVRSAANKLDDWSRRAPNRTVQIPIKATTPAVTTLNTLYRELRFLQNLCGLSSCRSMA